MMINKTDYLQHNGFSIATEFHRFMEDTVIPATPIDPETFWNTFLNVVTGTDTETTVSCESSDDFCNRAVTTIPVSEYSHPRDAAVSRGSLYDALYSDNVIPHCAGLKPGTGINAARHARVIRCARDFLDQTYPLAEGSHRDAVAYMVYFQNLLVILADGSTTGLQQPEQFVGRNGPSDKPESILLKHNGTHTEILFDCNGKTGRNDPASINDIQLEASSYKLFDLTADTVSRKCSTYSNWMQIVKSRHCRTFSDRNGDHSSIECKNRAITTTANELSNALILDPQGKSVPQARVDAVTAALINSAFTPGSNRLNIVVPQADAVITDGLIDSLHRMLALAAGSENKAKTTSQTDIKVFAAPADKPAQAETRSTPGALPLKNHAASVIGAMKSHGYDVKQAATI